MKRCPTDQGGCGDLTDFLFDSGLCSSCDAAVKRGTAAAKGNLGTVIARAHLAEHPPPFEPGAVGATDGRQVRRRGPRRVKREPKPDDGLCVKGCGKPRHRGRCAKPKAEAKPKRFEARMREMRQARVESVTWAHDQVKLAEAALGVIDQLFADLGLKP